MKKYDIIVIGAGGGTKLVTPPSKLGYKVAILEKESLGGTCLNRGCIPSKMIIYPADRVTEMKEVDKFEIGAPKEIPVDFEKLITRVSNSVDGMSQSIQPAYDKNPNIDFYHAEGKFVSNKVIEVAGEQITAERIFIVAGCRPSIPNIPGLEGTPYMTSREALRNTKLPKKLIVVGGGYIATELGHAYGGLGSEVHFLVRSRMLRAEDPDVMDEFEREFSKRYNVHMGATPTKIDYQNGEFTVTINQNGEEKTMTADGLLVVTGMKPNSDLLGLENTDIKLDGKGNIEVDDYLMTTADDVYAFGDIIGRYLFRHTANYEGEYLFDTLYVKKTKEPIVYTPVPHAVFTNPQVAGVGKTETELKNEGVDYVVGLNHYKNSAMGDARLSDHGFVKILVERSTKKILGVHIIGDEASDMIHMHIGMMAMGATLDDLLRMIYIHPALPEVARNAARKALAALEEG